MIRILQISEYKFKFFTLYFNIIGLQQSLIDLIGPIIPIYATTVELFRVKLFINKLPKFRT